MRPSLRLSPALAAIVAIALIAASVGLAAYLSAARDAAVERRAVVDAKTVTKIAVVVGETLRALDVALLAIADEVQASPKPDFDPELQRRARRLLKTIPGLFSSLVVDRSARLRHSFLVEASRNIPFRDRAYFSTQEETPGRGFYIGPAIESFTYGRRLIPTSLAMRDGDGAFAGIVTATLLYEAVLETLRGFVDPTQTVHILTRRGEIVVSTDPDAQAEPAAVRGVWPDTTGWLIDDADAESFITLQAVDLVDLVVALESDRTATAAAWRREAVVGGSVVAAFAALLVGAAAALHRTLSAQRALADALARSNADKTRMFSVLAHDLRGPFGAITGFASLLVSRAETAPRAELADFAAQIETTALALSHTCDSMLM